MRARPAARTSGRTAGRLLALVVAAAGLLLALAAPASAHASVVSTSPADGQSVPTSPAEFTVTFTEGVDVSLGGVDVLNRSGDKVTDGQTTVTQGGTVVQVPLQPDLAQGTYIATWRVVSADGHPISGSSLFAVGTPVDPSGMNGGSARTDPTWEVVGAVARFVTYTAALLAAGMAFFLAFLHDQRRDRWKLVPVVRIATLVGLIGTFAIIATQASLATGRGLDAATDVDVLRNVLTQSLGWSMVVLLLGLALVHLSTDTDRLLVAQGCAFYGGLAVVLSFVLWGHASESPYRWLVLVSDGVHVAAAAVWLGGLVGLAMVLRRRAAVLSGAMPAHLERIGPDDRDGPDGDGPDEPASAGPAVADADEGTGAGDRGSVSTRPHVTVTVTPRRELLSSTATIVGRFSTAAGASVVALLLAGVAMTWVQSGGSLSALWSTTYGRLVLAKVVLVVVVIGVAAQNRQRLVPAILRLVTPARTPDTDDADDTDGVDDVDDGAADDPGGAQADAGPAAVAARGAGPSSSPTGSPTGGAPDEGAADGVADRAWAMLRRNLVTEVLLLLAALAVTAVLVNVTPARTAVAQQASLVQLTAPSGDGTVQLAVSPLKAGPNTVRVQYVDASGAPVDVASTMQVEFTLPAQQLGPITRDVVKVGPGSFVLQGSEMSIPGEWQIAVAVRPSDFREQRNTFTVTVR